MSTTQTNKLSESLEDYLEAIFNIGGNSDMVHSKDIADSLGVARSSVTGALRALKKRRMVNYKPYDCVTLTELGHEVAAEIARKHNILKSFFRDILGVEENTAQKAACRAEHALGTEIIGKLLYFIEFVSRNGADENDFFETFRQFCGTKS